MPFKMRALAASCRGEGPTHKKKWPAIPDFLRETFLWKAKGYTYSLPPPRKLLDAAALRDPDPWIRLASVFEHAKAGDHAPIAMLHAEARDPDGSPMLGGTSLDLIAHAGGQADLEFLATMMLDAEVPDSMRVDACHAARCAGEAWLVEYMIASHRSDDRDGVSFMSRDCSTRSEDRWSNVNFRGIRDVLDQFDAQNAERGDVYEPGKRFFFGHPVPR